MMDSAPVDYQCKLVHNRVDNVSKHFSYLLQGFSSYARKMASVRDKGDDLVDIIISFIDNEPHNISTRRQLHECAHWLAMIQDFRHLAAHRIMSRIIPPIQSYQKISADLKISIKKCTTANEKTKASLESANKVKTKHGDSSAMFHTAFEVYRTNCRETNHQAEILRAQAKEFEEKKLNDTRKLLLEFISSELLFHCRAVELYTSAYRSVQGIAVEEDLNEFLDAYERMDDAANREVNTGPMPRENVHVRPVARMRGSISQPALHDAHDSDDSNDGYGRDGQSGLGRSGVNRTQSAHTNGQSVPRGPAHAPAASSTNRGQVARQRPNLEESDTD